MNTNNNYKVHNTKNGIAVMLFPASLIAVVVLSAMDFLLGVKLKWDKNY